MKKLTLFLVATLFSALSFAALNPYAYGLKSDLSDDEKTVTLTYSLNANATSVNIVILDGETVVKTQTSTGTAQGTHSVEVSTDGFDKGKTLSWQVEVEGAGVTDVECTNDATERKYMFYRPQGVAIDNNPESDFFGRIYIALPRGGYDHTKGIVVFDPIHDVLSNSGITATGVALGTNDTYAMHRIAVNPNGKVYYAKSESPTAIYELTPDNTNILSDGGAAKNVISSMSVITNANSLCFDKSGAMYVLGNAGYASATDTYTGKIYKIENGNISEFTKEYYRWASKDNSIVPDDRGGFWVAQQRTTFDGCDVLAHVNSNGVRDYQINKTTNNALLPTKTDGTSVNASYRGQVAHYLIDNNNGILAFGGGGKVSIFKVTYAADEVPTLTAWKTISLKSTSWKANVDGLAFDYAGNLIVMSATDETFEHYALPKDNNTCITPCPSKHAFSLTAPAQLNPFAYNLTSELSADEKDLKINYSLNAKATSVEWVLMDGNNVVKTIDLASLGLEKGDYDISIPTTDFPQYKQLTWKIEVKGVAVNEPTEYPVNHSIYHPSSVDIDNNPENETFGLLLVNEGMHEVKTKTKHVDGSTYISSGFGAGIFAFNPAFENTGKYNGGITFTNGRADNASATAYAPRRIRISEDGRIFVTSLNTDGNYLWEVNPESMNEWTPVFNSASINDNKEIIDASNNFIVGPNVGFDIKGSGENLKLMMYSVNLRGITAAVMSGFKCAEYNLGNGKSWNTTPSKMWVDGKYAISYNGTQVEYDNEGGIWIASYRGTASDANPGLVHINKDGVEDAKLLWNNVRNAGIRFNHDYTKLVVAGYNGAAKKATIYAVSKDASGKPVLTEETVINMATVGNNLNDFAWDYAGNLYACGNSNEKLAVWAMPHSSEDVVATPAASKYAFSIGKYTVTVNTNDVNKGTVTGGGEYGAGAVVTLTATPKEGYELLYWSDRSKENPRTITVDGNEALSAYFIKKNDVEPTFSITKVWENTNVPDSYTNGYQGAGWDGKIYVKDRWGAAINVYTETGSELYVSTDGLTTETVHKGDQALAIDNAGNIVIRSGSGEFFSNPTQITIYKKGEKIGKVIDFTLLETGRCDFISASGDIYSAEGGYVYFYCQNKTAVNRVKITNGAVADIDVVGGDIPMGVTQNHVIQDIFGNLVAHSRTNGIKALNVITNEASNFYILPNTLKTTTLGGCSFELSGKELWAYNTGTTAYTSEWNLYNVTDKENLSNEVLYVKDKAAVGTAANWLNVQVVDEKTAYIYQFCPQVGAAVWKVTRDHIVNATAVNGTVEGAGTYKDNATATLTATPNDGYLFKNWTKNGSVVSAENPYSFTVTEDVELVANFDGPFCELILNTNDENKGTVSGAGFYTQGQTATIKATPKPGYKLLYWSDRSTQATRTITMNKKEALSAYFVKVYDEEPTFAIEKVWENTQVPTSSNNGFQAVGWDEKIYMKDRSNKQILLFSDATPYTTYVATDDKDDQPIAIDDAGNIIIRSGSNLFYNAPKQVTIYKNGDKTGKVIDFTLPASGRCDFISASGDIYSAEGGYVYFYCENQTTVSRLYIKNGGASTADVSVDEVGTNLTAGSSQSHVFTNIFGDLMTHTRASVKVLQEVNAVTGVATTMTLPDFKESTLGGCSFELGGKELIAYNIKGTDYNSEWNLYNMTDKEFLSNETLYAKDRTSKKTLGAANWLNVQVVDEETAYIYQFCPEVAVAVWKVSLINTVVIDDKADNTTALAEYEGQKVTAKVTRAFNNDSYKTLTLPFDMDEEQIQAVFGDAKVYEFTSVVEGSDALHLQFEPTTSILAGTPYIIDLPDGDYDAKDGFTIENVTINTTLNSVKKGVITMEPVLNGGGRLDEAGQYWLSADNFLYNAGNYPTALLGLRAYFTSSSPMPIRARVVFDENQATSIPVVVAPENNVRKVMKNGQLIIIRGEQKYNIQGQRME